MKKWKLFVGLIFIFALGVLAGSLGSQITHKHRFERLRKDPATRTAFFLERLSEKLDLTAEQKGAFKEIVDRMEKRSREHFEQSRAQMKKIMDEGFSQMRTQLTPEQEKELEELQKKAGRFLKRRPVPPPPPETLPD